MAKFYTNARIFKTFMLTKLASHKVPLVMVSTHGSVVLLAMFFFYAKIVNVYLAIVVIISEHKQGHDGRQ